jgi:polysaccharide export outer membrane protein
MTVFRGVLAGIASFAMLAMLGGCEINDYLNPGEPTIQGKDAKPLVVPILDTLASGIEEPDTAYANATDMRPEDLVPDVADYKIGKNDLVSVSIFDLLGEGTGETVKTARVSETGMLSLPFISPVKAEGLTEQDLEQAIIKAYQDAKLIRQARVAVTVAEARNRTFSIQGNAALPGEYQITKPDFRMLDALLTAHAPVQAIGVDYAYIIRKLTPASTTAPGGAAPAGQHPATSPSDLLAPQSRANSASGAPLLMDQPAPNPGDFKFNDLQPPTDVRVIRVPINRLRQFGELQFNIVIRSGDMIIIPDPVTGVYYMGGHVARPGVFSLSGVKITLKQAWVASGGGDDFSVPRRSEVIRRVGAAKEVFVRVDLSKIWAGEQPDLYLKPNDMVMVGTNILAPFIASIRNSFRLTYGFGFLYDRNFYTGANGF